MTKKIRCKSCGTPSNTPKKNDKEVYTCFICQREIDKYYKEQEKK